MCDSTHLEYYLGSVLIPLAAWEAIQDRPPLATLLLSVGSGLLYSHVGQLADVQTYLLSTAGELVLVVYLARRTLAGQDSRAATAAAARWNVRARGTIPDSAQTETA